MNTPSLILIGFFVMAVFIVAAANYLVRKWPVFFPGSLGYPKRDEDVQFTVYKPSVVASGKWEKLVAFAHLSMLPADAGPDVRDPVAEVRERAALAFSETTSGGAVRTVDAKRAIPRSGMVEFRLSLDGLEIAQTERRFVWKGEVHQEEFEFRASSDMEGKVARGRLGVYAGWILLADIELSIQVNSARAKAVRKAAPETVSTAPYRKVFVSYSRKDKHVVDQVVGYVKATGDEFIRDVTHLRSGEEWDPELLRLIEQADVFWLFWSTNSMVSENVRREWEYALKLNRDKFIRPNYWENPFPEDPEKGLPPSDLRKLNFYQLPLVEGAPARAVAWAGPAHALGAAVLMVSVVANVLNLTNRGVIIDPALLEDLRGRPTPEASPTPQGTPTPSLIPTPIILPTPEATPVIMHSPTPQATPTARPTRRPTPQPTRQPTPVPTPSATPQATPGILDERARLDNFTVELQNDPTSQGYIICYSGRGGRKEEARLRCDRARNYLVSSRGIDASRLVTVIGGSRATPTVELFIMPAGIPPPRPSPDVDPDPI